MFARMSSSIDELFKALDVLRTWARMHDVGSGLLLDPGAPLCCWRWGGGESSDTRSSRAGPSLLVRSQAAGALVLVGGDRLVAVIDHRALEQLSGQLRSLAIARQQRGARRLRCRRRWLEQLTDDDLHSTQRTRWPLQDRPFGDVIAWANVELTKNAAELGYARFLYAVRPG